MAMIKLSDIRPNPNNPRTITKKDFERLKRSIKEFEKMLSLRPIVVDKDGTIIGGNMRYRALLELGYKEIPDDWIRYADDLTPEERRRFIIADNVQNGDWDWELLANEWDSTELNDWGLDVPKNSSNNDAIDIEVKYIIEVDLLNEKEQEKLFNELTKKGYRCRRINKYL